jgi:formate-dependent phosphoribosylglycinamide formyltransferase (GAR transformylase)
LAPLDIQNQVKQITTDFAKIIQSLSYKGFFGLDFLISNNQIYLLECNPRLTASFAFYTQIEINQNLNPLFLFHLSSFINLPSVPTSQETQSLLNSSEIIGSEITLKNHDSQTIKKYHDFTAFTQKLDPITIPQNIINLLHEKG